MNNRLYQRLLKVKDLPSEFIRIAKELDYPIFRQNPNYPVNLNIWGIRSKDISTKEFNDVICFFYEDKPDIWVCKIFEATTDPSNLNLEKPVNNKGCAILAEGFHRGIWKVGRHKGKYIALVQANDCTVIRDNNKDDKLDFNNSFDHGMFGINLHRASCFTKDTIGLYSAGCQVIKDYNLWTTQIEPLFDYIGSGTQSYVLINELDLHI